MWIFMHIFCNNCFIWETIKDLLLFTKWVFCMLWYEKIIQREVRMVEGNLSFTVLHICRLEACGLWHGAGRFFSSFIFFPFTSHSLSLLFFPFHFSFLTAKSQSETRQCLAPVFSFPAIYLFIYLFWSLKIHRKKYQ